MPPCRLHQSCDAVPQQRDGEDEDDHARDGAGMGDQPVATACGSSAISVKKSHCTAYPAAEGSVSEIAFSASGMNAPGFASAAPAPTIATAGEDATLLIRVTMPSTLAGSSGRFLVLATYP